MTKYCPQQVQTLQDMSTHFCLTFIASSLAGDIGSLMNQPHLWCPKVRLIHETRILGGGAASLQQRVKGQCATFEKANGYSGSKDERRRYGAAVA